jgi:hypothetical protein
VPRCHGVAAASAAPPAMAPQAWSYTKHHKFKHPIKLIYQIQTSYPSIISKHHKLQIHKHKIIYQIEASYPSIKLIVQNYIAKHNFIHKNKFKARLLNMASSYS